MWLDGSVLQLAGESNAESRVWLESNVVPLAFRLSGVPKARVIEVCRTDEPGEWTIPLA
jgi:hypothetical protein